LLALAFALAPAQASALTLVNAYDEGTLALPTDTAASGAAMTFSPDGLTIYLAGGEDDSLTALVRDPITGIVRAVDVERDGAGGVNGLDNAVAVSVSPDGRFIYAGGRSDQAVSVFERGPAPELLEFREVHRNGIAGVTGLTALEGLSVAPGGTHVYALSPNAATAAIFARTRTAWTSSKASHSEPARSPFR
jgi:6-phosphogluconolactonase (cycloisomerase 2 family)